MVMIIWRKMYTKMQCPTGLDIVLTVFMRFSLLCVIPHMCSGVLWARAWRVCVRVSPRMSSVYGLAAGASPFDTLPCSTAGAAWLSELSKGAQCTFSPPDKDGSSGRPSAKTLRFSLQPLVSTCGGATLACVCSVRVCLFGCVIDRKALPWL